MCRKFSTSTQNCNPVFDRFSKIPVKNDKQLLKMAELLEKGKIFLKLYQDF